jgi:hypothetical protein
LLAGHVGSGSRFPAGEFLDKMSGKAGESRHHEQHGPLEARPAAGFAPRPVLPDVGRPMFLGLQGSSKGSFVDNAHVAIFDSHNDVDGLRAGRF